MARRLTIKYASRHRGPRASVSPWGNPSTSAFTTKEDWRPDGGRVTTQLNWHGTTRLVGRSALLSGGRFLRALKEAHMNPTDEYVGAHKAARMLGVAPLTLRQRILRGELEAFEDPLDARRRLIRTADLETLKTIRPARQVA